VSVPSQSISVYQAPEGDCPTCDGITTHVGACDTERFASDLYAAGFYIVALDVARGRRSRHWALEHVRARTARWPGAQTILNDWEANRAAA